MVRTPTDAVGTTATAFRVVFSVLAAAAFVGACNPQSPSTPTLTDVAIQDDGFVPTTVTIKVNDGVRWTNLGSLIHTTTSGQFATALSGELWDSGDLAPGEVYIEYFGQVGEFEYHCELHPEVPGLNGARVIVEP
jgi:plastocyanin